MEGQETSMGRKPTEEGRSSQRPNASNVKKLAEYLFLTEQMNWKKSLKLFAEKGEWGH